jgi:hypothetical protein
MGRLLRINELLKRVKARPSKRGTHQLRGIFIQSPDQRMGDFGRVGLRDLDEEIGIKSRDDSSTQSSTTRMLPEHPAVRVPKKAELRCK